MIAINSPNMMRVHNQCQQSNFQPRKVLFLLNKGIFGYLSGLATIGGATMPPLNHRDAIIISHCDGPEPLPSMAFMPLDDTIRYPCMV